ncbi:alpha/beta fold hydrolase [Nocardioides marmorisolisilvae]|uniref:Alpha/beta fold hydrolase n=1 Tax=Nocardioides marmorisolisilvae TaxID=1542737 RepID=A0A3N0DW65_9ACTN|nr:alpha/beta hydrolase [Nocardioides marmorisolisilvae]RNL79693.1 alpha/beta fold hydrolase [Nocardioides marmorisolisilvae]
MTLVSERIGQLFVDDFRIEFTEYGGGSSWVVLVPGQLMPRRMHEPLARKLAATGAHVVTIDLLGHGRSDRPADPLLYSSTAFAEQVVALLDHLGAERAVIGGTSLGANVALEVAVAAPERVQGLLLEAPVLENAVEAGLLTSTPLLFASRFLPASVTGVRLLTRLVPRGVVPFWVGIALDTLHQRPAAMRATLHGLAFGRTAPPASERAAVDVPALVVGHPGDPLHPVADAQMVAEELTASQYVAARSALEWRTRPERLDAAAFAFVQECFESRTGRLLGASS